MSETPNTPTTEPTESDPNADSPEGLAGGMGVSSERTGPTGGEPAATNATEDTSVRPADPDAPPEQAPGGPEDNPEGLTPKAGYSDTDPRSDG